MMTYQDEIFEIEEQDNYFHTNKNSKLINKNGLKIKKIISTYRGFLCPGIFIIEGTENI
jgi:hypothetical protein